LNPRHEDFQSSALPTELPSHLLIITAVNVDQRQRHWRQADILAWSPDDFRWNDHHLPFIGIATAARLRPIWTCVLSGKAADFSRRKSKPMRKDLGRSRCGKRQDASPWDCHPLSWWRLSRRAECCQEQQRCGWFLHRSFGAHLAVRYKSDRA